MKKIFAAVVFAVMFAGLNAQAQSVVNKNSGGASTGVTSFTVTLPSVSSGNLLTVGVGWCGGGTGCGGGNTSSNTMTVSDSAGNTLTVPSGVTLIGDALASSIAQGVVTSASSGTDTFTIHFSSAVDYPQVSVSQISPPSGYSFSTADGSGTTAYTTGSSLSLSLTTSNAEDLLYSFTWDDVFNAGSGQTTINQNSGDGVTDSFVLETSSGSHSMSYSAGSYTGTEAGSMTAYKLTSGGGGGGEGPYGGTAASIPGTVQAENYDTGGDGVGYNASSNGTGNSYRSDGDDLETTSDTGGGYDLGWTASGQWFRYTVDVSTAGTYTVTFRVASPSGVSDAFHIANSSGTNLSGSVSVPDTGGWQDWTNVTATVSLPAGTQVLTLDEDNAGWNLNYMTFSSTGGGEGPYGGTAASIPGTVQAENYDTGGNGVGYSASSNGTGNSYRSDGDDLETTSDTGGGYDLGWTASGQWFRYTVNVASSGTYTVTFRVAANSGASNAFHLADSSGDNLSGSVSVPDTGGWQNWTNVTATVTLSAGTQVLTLDEDNSGWNLNYMTFSSGGCTPTTITPYIQVNGGSWQETSSATVSSGSTVNLGPQPVSGGTWSWTGPSGFTSTSREIDDIALSSGTNVYTATYTNSSGCQSTETFTIMVTGGGGGTTPYGVSPPSGKSWVLTFDDEFTSDSSSIQISYPPSGSSITTSEGTWSWGANYGGGSCSGAPATFKCEPNQWAVLLNGSGVAAGSELALIGGNLYLSDNFYSWYVRQSGSWVSTSDPSIGVGPVSTSKWNGGASNTDWCNVAMWENASNGGPGGTFMFSENSSNPCGDFYDGLSLSSSNGLSMQSAGAPSAALQTGGSSASSALFIQEYGYWESSFEVPSANDGDGGVANHSDFWMHPVPEDPSGSSSSDPTYCSGPCIWLPEFDIGERPTWNSSYASANNVISFSIDDADGSSTGGYFSASGSPDLSAGFHKYALSWLNDGSGPYGSMQIYLDGTPLLSSRWVLSSSNTNLASGIYVFLSVDNDGVGYAQPFNVQYVRIWQAE